MKHLGVLSLLLLPGISVSQEQSDPIKPIPPENLEWHKQLLVQAKKGNIDVVFFGDSSTAGWTTTGSEVWKKHLEPLKTANFGVNGNSVGQLLWRLQNGEIEGYKPKVAVLWIGHVNIFQNKQDAGAIADGIIACVQEIHKKQPEMKILLMALFHAYPQWTDKQRATVLGVNKLLAKQADGKKVRLLDVSERFAAKKDELLKELAEVKDPHKVTLMYKIWGEALEEPLKAMLKDKPVRTLNDFQKTLDKTFTPAKSVATFGEPDRRLGSGLIIFEYDLEDGTKTCQATIIRPVGDN
jgi:GDSL-like Lipase/Acylhydrolase family